MYPLKIKEKYDRNNLENLSNRFSVPYLGNYKEGDMREESGSHPGVDIRPETPNQDVFCVLPGKVFKAGQDGSYGNYVFIEHPNVPHPDDLSKTTTLYSCYQHLSEYSVKEGDILKEGDKIGKTGNTGISFGEHLHFQIDRQEAPFHSYWPYTGAEAKEAGVTFSDGVNLGLGRDKAKMYTVNPLVYLDRIAGKNIAPILTENKREEIKVTSNTTISSTTSHTTTTNTNSNPPKVEEIKREPVTVIEDSISNTPVNNTNTTTPTPANNNSTPVRETIVTSDPNDGVLKGLSLDEMLGEDKKKI